MDELLKTVGTQAPGLVVLVLLVRWGSSFMEKFIEGRDQFIRLMHQEHLAARELGRLAIEQNAQATRENTKALHDLEEAVKRKL